MSTHAPNLQRLIKLIGNAKLPDHTWTGAKFK